MSTQKQIDANRLNAQKSTGPRTPEGRAAVRLNGVTHGLTAKTLVLKGESEDDFKAIFEAFEAEYEPATPTEETLVAQLAMATWRLRRVYNMEAGYYSGRLSELADYADKEKLDHSRRLGIAADTNSNPIAMIGRQEARLERSYYRALHELQRLRAQRPATIASQPQDESGLVCKQPEVPLNSPSDSRIKGISQPPSQAPQAPAAPPCTS